MARDSTFQHGTVDIECGRLPEDVAGLPVINTLDATTYKDGLEWHDTCNTRGKNTDRGSVARRIERW